MRRILIIFNNIFHALIGAGGLLFLAYRFFQGAPFSVVAVMILIPSVPMMALGIGAFIRPQPAQKAMLGFHYLWLLVSLIWALVFWHMVSTYQVSGWGALAYIIISIPVYSVTLLSLLTISLYTSVWQIIGATLRTLIAATKTMLPAWVSWKNASVVTVVALIGLGGYETYQRVSAERKSQAHQQVKADLKKGKNKLSFFSSDWRKTLTEMEVFVPGEMTSEQKDYWNTPYRILHETPQLRKYNQYSAVYQVISAGPDRLFDTPDDIKQGGWLRELIPNSKGTYNYHLRKNSPTMARLEQITESRAFVFPHSRKIALEESFELNEVDKWGQHLRVDYAGLDAPTVTAYSAGIDGRFDTKDDLFVTRNRISIEPQAPIQQAEKLVVDSETRRLRNNTFELVKTVAAEKARLEAVAKGYHSPLDPSVLMQTDAWQRPLELYHGSLDRNSVYVYSRGQDGIAGSFDDLVWAASDPAYSELLTRIKKNHLPVPGSDPTAPFFEVKKSSDNGDVFVQVILPGTTSDASQDSLREEFPVFHMATVEGNSCPAELVEFKSIAPICCPQSIPPKTAGMYRVEAGCQVKHWNRAFPVELDYIEFFNLDETETLTGKTLMEKLAFGFLFESCEYHRKDTAEFFSCRQIVE